MKKMWKGNHAIAEAALRAGCQFYAGYPITPQTEVGEYLSSRMPELGRTFLQAENEMSAVYMIFGSYACGMRSMTSSSGPGFSLKQEGIAYMCANNYPAVFANVQRWGPGLGTLDSAQTDYLRDTRGCLLYTSNVMTIPVYMKIVIKDLGRLDYNKIGSENFAPSVIFDRR